MKSLYNHALAADRKKPRPLKSDVSLFPSAQTVSLTFSVLAPTIGL